MIYFDELLEAVAAEIQGLNLDRIGAKVHVKSVGDDEEPELSGEGKLPAVVVSPFGTEQILQAYNNCDNISHPCLVMTFDSAAKENDRAALRRRLTWRQQIFHHFHMVEFRSPNGVAWYGKVDFNVILDTGSWFEKGVYVGGLTVQAVATRVMRRRPT